MSLPILRVGTVKDVSRFQQHLSALGLNIPCDAELIAGSESPLRQPLSRGEIKLGNRIAAQPMEGWDATPDGNVTESMLRRWVRLGSSGAKLIWGGEAAAVCHAGRANPNQLVVAPHTLKGLAQLRTALLHGHRQTTGSAAHRGGGKGRQPEKGFPSNRPQRPAAGDCSVYFLYLPAVFAAK